MYRSNYKETRRLKKEMDASRRSVLPAMAPALTKEFVDTKQASRISRPEAYDNLHSAAATCASYSSLEAYTAGPFYRIR